MCVKLYTDADYCETEPWDENTPVATVEADWIDVNGAVKRKYDGQLTYCGHTIDFEIEFDKDPYTLECDICFRSEMIGDSCVPMGGDYREPAVKRAECRTMEFEFPVDLSAVAYGGVGTGRITIAPADYQTEPSCPDQEECYAYRVCITRTDTYGNEYQNRACLETFYDGSRGWEAYTNEEETEAVLITREDTEDGDVFLNFELGDETARIQAECPAMYAVWTLYDGSSVKVEKDRKARCTDCKCYCRCLCVTYQSSDGVLERGIACEQRDIYGCRTVFSVTLADKELEFYLRCDGCETLSTVLGMSGLDGGTLVTEKELDILCPDGLEAQWTYQIANSQTATIYVECVQCGSECSVDELGVHVLCCPDRETNIPRVLYATIESAVDCPSLDGAVIPLALDSALGADSSCWTGTITVPLFGGTCIQRISVMCTGDGAGGNVWRITQTECGIGTSSTHNATVISCDPLELTITFYGVGCCEGGVGATIGVRITE